MTTTYIASLERLHANFLEILPRIETHARIAFRHIRCPGKREDAVAETIAVSWKWFLRVTEQGKDVNEFVSTLATFAARHVRSGRHLCGQEPSNDCLSSLAQRRHSFTTETLSTFDTGVQDNPALEALRDNTITPPPDQATFRIDFASWLASLGDRNHQIAQELMMGERTLDVAPRYGLSQARISQLRRELMLDWQRFCGEAAFV